MKIEGAWVLLTGLMSSASVWAGSVFDGTWRPDPEIYASTRKVDVIELADGNYACQSCTPSYRIKADGMDQTISGNPYYDTVSIAVANPTTVKKIAKKSGKTMAESEITLSSDGKTLTERQTIYFIAPRPIEMTTHSQRVSTGSSGSPPISGSWRATDSEISNHAEDTIFKISGNSLEMSDRMGRSFTAKLDGTEAAYRGSDEFTGVTLKKIDDHTIEESDRRDGKVIKISLWSVGSDGTTINVRFDDTQGHIQQQTGHRVSTNQ